MGRRWRVARVFFLHQHQAKSAHAASLTGGVATPVCLSPHTYMEDSYLKVSPLRGFGGVDIYLFCSGGFFVSAPVLFTTHTRAGSW